MLSSFSAGGFRTTGGSTLVSICSSGGGGVSTAGLGFGDVRRGSVASGGDTRSSSSTP